MSLQYDHPYIRWNRADIRKEEWKFTTAAFFSPYTSDNVFTSCKKGDDPPAAPPSTNNSTNQESIIGTWTWTEAYTPDANGGYHY